ncbi:hypothetical protein G3480_19675 [Thiorhodococcus mannitoliphagus]|uniref:Uncharacterized protein n=1 Tax=Thiorhodococcus mannitoliphagus TaxID=329406 RepID=A0A6P1DYE4_9GAMM|nr:hypothetical protein [Thiorhodococcus mannitoliphagus]NEX22500.1 hypothetical protein [Thiorhodococcus mannitoliphagus]
MYSPQIQTQPVSHEQQNQERARRLRGVLTELSLRDENLLYANTRGISQNNQSLGFRPGYLNSCNGECALSRFSDGSLAPVHLLEGLPEHWIRRRDQAGKVTQLEPGIVSGFIREGRFFTREEAMSAAAH